MLIWPWRLTSEPSWNFAPPPVIGEAACRPGRAVVPNVGVEVSVMSRLPVRTEAVSPSTSAWVPLMLTWASWPKSLPLTNVPVMRLDADELLGAVSASDVKRSVAAAERWR